MLSEAVVLAALHFQFVVSVIDNPFLHAYVSLQSIVLNVFLLHDLLDPVDFYLSDVQLVLVLLNTRVVFLLNLSLLLVNGAQALAHLVDLLRLSVVDVGLARNLLMALLNLFTRRLIFACHLTQVLLGFSKLNLDVTQRVFEFAGLNFTEAKHLLIFVFSSVRATHSEALASNTRISVGGLV